MIDLFGSTLTTSEFVLIIVTSIPYLILHFIIGFGPGFILGILLTNWIAGRGQPTHMEVHQENIKKAAEHNAQWHPSNERWKKR